MSDDHVKDFSAGLILEEAARKEKLLSTGSGIGGGTSCPTCGG